MTRSAGDARRPPGTRRVVARPASPTEAASIDPLNWYLRDVTHDPPRVLVVDDMDDIRTLIAINLQLEGFDVRTAVDGAECLEIVEDVAPDVITLDVAMKGLDGFSTAELLRGRKSTAGIPLVIVTARAQGYDRERGAG